MRFTIVGLVAFLILGGVATYGAIVPPGACPVTSRDLLLGCFSDLIDNGGDGNITVAELDAFFNGTALTCLPTNTEFTSNINSSYIMTLCDADMDGVLSMADFDSPNACMLSEESQFYICTACYVCGWEGPIVKKRGTLLKQSKNKL